MKSPPSQFQLLVALMLSAPTTLAIPCQIELDLDHNPEEVAWEIRGPVPTVEIVGETNYRDYTTPHILVQEYFYLQPEEDYYLIILDEGEDGIREGSFSLSCRFGGYERILLAGNADYGAGEIYKFSVRPPKRKTEDCDEEVVPSSIFWPLF
mmetsp:Transcript_10638/g.14094  ORF Transcript_10638/g.14094 Transcript_10638/m.14094 type:complete len:152 (-) Transcript_10638:222-677(-)